MECFAVSPPNDRIDSRLEISNRSQGLSSAVVRTSAQTAARSNTEQEGVVLAKLAPPCDYKPKSENLRSNSNLGQKIHKPSFCLMVVPFCYEAAVSEVDDPQPSAHDLRSALMLCDELRIGLSSPSNTWLVQQSSITIIPPGAIFAGSFSRHDAIGRYRSTSSRQNEIFSIQPKSNLLTSA